MARAFMLVKPEAGVLADSDVVVREGFAVPDDLARLIADESSALFLDVDGTLLALRPLPTDVLADDVLRALMTALQSRCGGALALVSGRTIADVDRIFSPLTLAAAGTHGAELRFADGTYQTEASDLMDDVRPAVRDLVDRYPGLLVEDKGRALAVHFRQCPELEHDVVQTLTALVAGRDLSVQRGKMVAELKPANIDKGRAIARLMADRPFAGKRAVFFGDDITDESGFRYVNSVGGVSVRVGSLADRTSAERCLPDVDAVVATLNALCSNEAKTAPGEHERFKPVS